MLISLISLLVAAAESLTYIGFVQKHFFVPSYLFYFLGVLAFCLTKSLPTFVKKTLFFSTMMTSVLLLVLNTLEDINYPNFVYTHLHVNIPTLQILVFLLGCYSSLIILVSDSYLIRLGKSILVGGLICIGAIGLGRSLGILVNGLVPIIEAPLATYDQKMEIAYPGFYPAMQLIKRVTNVDSAIIIPPQANPWEMEGNGAIMTYFLYPRRIITTTVVDPFPTGSGSNTFAIIARGSWVKTGDVDYGWPKVELAATKLWHFDVTHGTIEQLARNYSPETDKWDWGLIEVAP